MRQSCERRGQHLHLCSSALPLLVTLANFTAHCVLNILVVLFPVVLSTEFAYRKGASQFMAGTQESRATCAVMDATWQLCSLDLFFAVTVAKGTLAVITASSPWLFLCLRVQGALCMVVEATHPVNHEH